VATRGPKGARFANGVALSEMHRLVEAGYTRHHAANQVVARGLMQAQQSPGAAIKWLERNYKIQLPELIAQRRRAQSRRTVRLELARVIAEEQMRRADFEARAARYLRKSPELEAAISEVQRRQTQLDDAIAPYLRKTEKIREAVDKAIASPKILSKK
jgi:hypothetical protein